MSRHSPVLRNLATGLLFAGLLGAVIHARQTPGAAPAGPDSPQSAEFFEAKIRPLLVRHCFECHTDKAEGDLRLDSREAMLRGGEGGPVIIPGDPDKSLLIQAVRHTPGVARMPRGESSLRPDEIDALVAWVRAEAPWPAGAAAAAPAPVASPGMVVTDAHRAYWSVKPLARPAVPVVKDAAWAKTDIDRFILSKLEHEGLAPMAPADKLTMLRRVTLDLTGLLPTAEEVDAYLTDPSATAWDTVIDRLLASPRYGERWGRMWLDVARYGEDDYRSLDPQGRGFNPYPHAYLYRDWVIKAFNDDLPYDQFVRAQIAADLFGDTERLRHLPALGFLGLGPWYYDNGAVEITRADERNDRVDAVGRGFLGLTVSCARCHDHKYDPIPTTDYYAMAGVFLNTEYHEYPQAPKALVEAYKAQEKAIEKKQELLGQYQQNESQQLAETLAFQAEHYMVSAWRVTGEPKHDKFRVVEEGKLDYELFDRWLRFLAKPPSNYPYLKSWQEMIKAGGTEAEAKRLGKELQSLLIEVLLERRAVKEENDIITAKALPGTKKKEPANKPNEFITNDDFCPGCGLELKTMPLERMNLWTDAFARDLDDTVTDPRETKPGLLAFRGWGLERRLGPDRRTLIQGLRDDIAAMTKALPDQYPYVHGVRDLDTPRNLPVALRGSPYRSGDIVPRGFVTVLGGSERLAFTKGSGRLELADAILAQPITARVIVNRIWKGHFGTGLVDTPSNFGWNGEKPSHPELLDHLAQAFLDQGQSIKTLHRAILRSAVYQLSTAASATHEEKDAGNRWYWRANRTRMSAEQLRDSVLFVSGTLDETIGGPSAPLTPLYPRRTIYGKVSRYKLDEFLQLFDFPSPNQSAEKRYTTHVPLQRLFLMNSDFMQQQAERLAALVTAKPTDEARITELYRRLFGRAPSAEELAVGVEFLLKEPMRQYEERKAEAAKPADPAAPVMAATPAAAPGPMADGMMAGVRPGAGGAAELKDRKPVTALGRYIKILLSSNEFIFIN